MRKGQATATVNSVWLGAVCQWCRKPLVAASKVTKTESGPVVTGQYPWTHTSTGEEHCDPRHLIGRFR